MANSVSKNDREHSNVPIGFTFTPTDEELFRHYLMKKISNLVLPITGIQQVDVFEYAPNQLTEMSYPLNKGSEQWYFFSPWNVIYTCTEQSRTVGNGVWKVVWEKTIDPRFEGHLKAVKKLLCYYELNHIGDQEQSEWRMHEYRVENLKISPSANHVLCKLFKQDTMILLQPGIRFLPTDVELINDYLSKKVHDKYFDSNIIPVVEAHNYIPENLTRKFLMLGNQEWYFFTMRNKKGAMPIRKVGDGHWKNSGNNNPISFNGETIGIRKTFSFQTGGGKKTSWKMREYRLTSYPNDNELDQWVVWKLYKDKKTPEGAQNAVPSSLSLEDVSQPRQQSLQAPVYYKFFPDRPTN